MSWLTREILREIEGDIARIIVRYGADVLGIDHSEVNDPSEKCKAVLSRPLDRSICQDFRGIRRWVLCRAWQLLDSGEAKMFRTAIRRAWSEAKRICYNI